MTYFGPSVTVKLNLFTVQQLVKFAECLARNGSIDLSHEELVVDNYEWWQNARLSKRAAAEDRSEFNLLRLLVEINESLPERDRQRLFRNMTELRNYGLGGSEADDPGDIPF